MGKPFFQKVLTRETTNATSVIAEAIKIDRNLDLLVVILPGKTDFYGMFRSWFVMQNMRKTI